MQQILPGIYRVAHLNWDDLPENMVLKGLANASISISATVTDFPLIGSPKCTISRIFVGNKQKEEVNLSFFSTEKVESIQNMAFIVATVDAGVFAIGDKSWPKPEVKVEFETGDPKGSPSRYEYKVKWQAELALVKVKLM